jgi:hypothetical protein
MDEATANAALVLTARRTYLAGMSAPGPGGMLNEEHRLHVANQETAEKQKRGEVRNV